MKLICPCLVFIVCLVVKVAVSGPPRCPVIYNELIPQNTPVGRVILTLVCTDPDGDDITYLLIRGNEGGEFRLQGNQIILAKTIIPSIIYKFVLEVHAVDTQGERGFASVNIGLASSNDYDPVVTWKPDPINIKETAPIGTLVGQCTVRDEDQRKGTLAGQTRVDFLKPDIRAANKWLLDKNTCHLYVNDILNFDTKKSYTLKMVAYDLDPYSPRTVTHQITILVTNDPDSLPKCSTAYEISHIFRTMQIGGEITRIECTDADVGVAGQITYEIDERNTRDIKELFQIQSNTGSLSLKTPITSDSIPAYEVLVNVKDGGTPSFSSKVLVRVIITDVPQDGLFPPSIFTDVFSNPVMYSRPAPIDTRLAPPIIDPAPRIGFPICPRYSVTAIISEGNPIFKDLYDFGCTDPEGDNLMYFITRGNVYEKFKIVGSKLQLEKPLNADGRDKYQLRIIVHDDSGLQFSSTLTIAVLVSNINDNPPIIRDLPPKIEVSEKAQFGTIAYKCDVTDKDDATDPAGQTRITWQNPDDPSTKNWLLDSVTCNLYVNAQLDYERQPVYDLGIIVRDLDPTTPLTSTYTFTIMVTDENEPPVCQPFYISKLPPNSFVGTLLAGVICTDADSGENGRISYKLDESNSGTIKSQFSVNGNGMVFLQSSLNSDPSPSYEVKVVAFDGGTPSLSSTSTVLIIKGTAPTCGKNKSVSIDMTSPVGTVVADLQCSDVDPGDTLTYSFISGNTGNQFIIDNGLLKLAKRFEAIYRFMLDIKVMDKSSAKILVRVAININDYPPVIDGVPGSLSVIESAPRGKTINTCTVTDGDQPRGTPAGQTQLGLKNIDGTVVNDWSLGEGCQLRINTRLDHETIANYTLVLLAWDLDPIAPKTSSVTFTVTVDDFNDNSPICPTIFRVDIQENATSNGAVVDSISCADADSGNNGQIYFKLSDINTAFVKTSFVVNVTTGRVELQTILDYEKQTSHQVRIVAEDGGVPALSSTITVSVNVINIDDVPTTTPTTTTTPTKTTTSTTTTTIPTTKTPTTPIAEWTTSSSSIPTTTPYEHPFTNGISIVTADNKNTDQPSRMTDSQSTSTSQSSARSTSSHMNSLFSLTISSTKSTRSSLLTSPSSVSVGSTVSKDPRTSKYTTRPVPITSTSSENTSSKPVKSETTVNTSQITSMSTTPWKIFTSNVPPKLTTTYEKTTPNYPPLHGSTSNSDIPPIIRTTLAGISPPILTSRPLTPPPVSTDDAGIPPPVTTTVLPPRVETTIYSVPPDMSVKPPQIETPMTSTQPPSTVPSKLVTTTAVNSNSAKLIHAQKLVVLVNVILTIQVVTM